MTHKFMKLAKVKSEKEFYKKFPTEEHFFKAHPMARYGYALKADGGTPMELNGPQAIQNPQGLPTRDIEAGMNAAGPMGQQNIYQAQQQYDTSMPIQGQPGNVPGSGPSGMADAMDDPNEPNQPGTPPDMGGNNNNKGLSKRQQAGQRFKQGAAKVGQWAGEHAGDMWATGAQLANLGTQPTPVRQNINPYQMAINSNPMGTGSHAAYANGGKMKKGKKAADGIQIPYVSQFQPQQPLDWDRWNAFHANQYQTNPQYGSDALNHGNFNNAALEQWNKANPQQAIPQSDINRYQQEGANDPTVKKEFGVSGAEGKLGQKTTGYSKRKYTDVQVNAQGTPYYTEEHGTHPLAANQVGAFTDRAHSSQRVSPQYPTTDPVQQIPERTGFNSPQASTAPQPQGLKATGFPTLQEAKAKGKQKEQKSNWYQDTPEGAYDYKAYTGTKMFPDSINRGKKNTYFDDPVKSIHMDNGGYMKMDAGGFSNTPIHIQGPAEYLSPESIELQGNSHAAQGQKIYANGTHVEAEGPNGDGTGVGEIVANEPRTGTPHVLGNLRTLPETAMKLAEMGVKVGNNMKHKEVGEIIAKAEKNNDKMQTKVNYLLNTNQPGANYQGPSFNSGKVLADAYAQNKVKTDTAKQLVMDDMNMQNDIAEKMGMAPKKVGSYMKDAQKLSAKYGVKMAAGGSLYQPLEITPAMPTQHSQITPLYDIAPMTMRKDWANDGSAGGKPRSYITKSPTTVPGDMIFAAKGAKVPAAQRDNTPLTAQDIAEFEDLRKSNPEMFTEDYGQGRKNAKLPGEGKAALWGPGYRNVKAHAGKYKQTPNPPDYMSVAYPPYIVPVGDDNPHITVPEVDWNNRKKLNTQPGPDGSMMRVPNAELNKYTPAQRPTTHKGIRNRAGITDYLPEIMSAFDQIDPVQSLQARTNLEDTYSISFQNQKNDIQQAYGPAMKAAANNPGAQAAIAGEMAEKLKQVDAQELQYNQQNQGGIRGRNIERLDRRDAMNLQLDSQKLERQAAAKEAHNERIFGAASSVSNKEAQRRAQNWQLGAYEHATGYVQGRDGKMYRTAPDYEYMSPVVPGTSLEATKRERKYGKKSDGTSYSEEKIKEGDYYGGSMMAGGSMSGFSGGQMAMRGPSYFGAGGADTKKKKKRKS